jgi:hypothetical protein
MQLNGSALNSTTLNASNFPIISSGALISFEQDVRLRITGSGSLIDVEQEVKTLASGSLISIAQKISSVEESTFFSRNGWALSITLDGFNVPADTRRDGCTWYCR